VSVIRRLAIAALAWASTACAVVGKGEGQVHSDALYAAYCWHSAFDLDPDFFAAQPFRDTMQIRIQRGSDLAEVSDGLEVLVNEVTPIRQNHRGAPIEVGLAPRLLSKIAPAVPQGPPPRVSMALYLQYSCHNQNIVLYALKGTITFGALFSGDPNEKVGSEKLTDATFDVIVGDPRDAIPGTLDLPSDKTSRVTGHFKFHFQRGQPGQPFP
jgi:hypothetical protein